MGPRWEGEEEVAVGILGGVGGSLGVVLVGALWGKHPRRLDQPPLLCWREGADVGRRNPERSQCLWTMRKQ